MQTPKVSIIVPIYNVSKYLEKCLSSIVNQTLKDIEIILINDCSPDPEDEQICRKFSTIDKRILYVSHKNNLGVGGARNTGIKLAKSEYIAFIDSDDSIKPDMIEVAYNTAITDKVDIVVFGFDYIDENEIVLSTHLPNGNLNSNLLKCFLEKNDSITPLVWDKLWKKSLFTDNNVNFPLGVYFEDMMIMPQLLYYANKITVLEEAYYVYLRRDGSTMQTISNKHIDDAFFSYDYVASFLRPLGELEKYNSLIHKQVIHTIQAVFHHNLNSKNQTDNKDIFEYLVTKMTAEKPDDVMYYFPHRYYSI